MYITSDITFKLCTKVMFLILNIQQNSASKICTYIYIYLHTKLHIPTCSSSVISTKKWNSNVSFVSNYSEKRLSQPTKMKCTSWATAEKTDEVQIWASHKANKPKLNLPNNFQCRLPTPHTKFHKNLLIISWICRDTRPPHNLFILYILFKEHTKMALLRQKYFYTVH